MIVKDVIEYVQSNIPFKYYANEFPKNENKDCGIVRIEGGSAPSVYIDGLKSPTIQIIVRHESGNDAERISKTIWNLFHNKAHYSIGNTKVYFSWCEQSEPIYLSKDNNGRTLYSINVACKIYD